MTEFGSKKELQKSIRWDTIQKKSDIWSSFDQVVNARTSEPKPRKNIKQSIDQLLREMTSPFGQAFMAITGYFLDRDWNYCEVLLGFEHI
ncbi:hypothetical protein N7505_007518 [Penicillium chrysogenum]|uniref:Uncharacterized protein n=1 Tax=Penicillium chrysogenum TaxID=5076 RepID=A0ABQ8WDP3_PENCH|nr:hypothetical protein N7505_007518 [Penicillium chrysogenum]